MAMKQLQRRQEPSHRFNKVLTLQLSYTQIHRYDIFTHLYSPKSVAADIGLHIHYIYNVKWKKKRKKNLTAHSTYLAVYLFIHSFNSLKPVISLKEVTELYPMYVFIVSVNIKSYVWNIHHVPKMEPPNSWQ